LKGRPGRGTIIDARLCVFFLLDGKTAKIRAARLVVKILARVCTSPGDAKHLDEMQDVAV
jgi:hypothetical protein